MSGLDSITVGAMVSTLLALASACGPAQLSASYPPMTIRAAPPLPDKPSMARLDEIAHQIQFETAKATLLPDSFRVLDEVGIVLQANPQVQRIEIQGHTDNVGRLKSNLTLSQERAQAVMDYLVRKGTPAHRLTAKGYGPTKPIADNGSEEGRARNRRVEFLILDQDG